MVTQSEQEKGTAVSSPEELAELMKRAEELPGVAAIMALHRQTSQTLDQISNYIGARSRAGSVVTSATTTG